MTKDSRTPVAALHPTVFENFAKQFPLHVSKETTPIQAGEMLGMQRVLLALRAQHVIGT